MADYQVAIFVLLSVAGGIALAVWILRRFALRLRGALVSAAIASLVAVVGYWLGIGLAFTYLDVATGVAPQWWAGWVVGVLFAVGLAAAAFGVAAVAIVLWTTVAARRAPQRGDSDPAVEHAHRADAAR